MTEQIVGRHPDANKIRRSVGEINIVHRARRGSPQKTEHVLEHQEKAEGDQELIALVAAIDGAQHALDRQANETDGKPSEDQDRKEQRRRHAEVDRKADRGNAEIRAKRVKRTAGQIDDLLHAEHELQSGRHEKQHRGVEYPAEGNIHKFSHASDRHFCRLDPLPKIHTRRLLKLFGAERVDRRQRREVVFIIVG